MYNSPAERLPSSSIGPRDGSLTGTLTCYVKHRDEHGRANTTATFALTCQHVVATHALRGKLDNAVIEINCPQAGDHRATVGFLTNKIEGLKGSASELELATLQAVLNKATAYDVSLGCVSAASGKDEKLAGTDRLADWSLVSITNSAVVPQNKACTFIHPSH